MTDSPFDIKMLSLLFSLTASKAKKFEPIKFPEWANKTREAIVTGKKGLILYDSLKKNKTAIMTVPFGQNVTVIGSYPIRGFYRIKYNETIGFGSGYYILFTTNATIGVNISIAAINKIGCGYTYGMAGPDTFDNAGLIYYAHKAAGVKIPRLAKDIYSKGQIVIKQRAQPGDILCFLKDTNTTTKVPSMGIITYARGATVKYVGIFKPDTVVAERKTYLRDSVSGTVRGGASSRGQFDRINNVYEVRRFW